MARIDVSGYLAKLLHCFFRAPRSVKESCGSPDPDRFDPFLSFRFPPAACLRHRVCKCNSACKLWLGGVRRREEAKLRAQPAAKSSQLLASGQLRPLRRRWSSVGVYSIGVGFGKARSTRPLERVFSVDGTLAWSRINHCRLRTHVTTRRRARIKLPPVLLLSKERISSSTPLAPAPSPQAQLANLAPYGTVRRHHFLSVRHAGRRRVRHTGFAPS